MRIKISSSAAEDIRSAVVYYSERSPELPASFIDDFDAACSLISDSPQIGSPIGEGNRKLVMQRFPFIVIYRIDEDQVFVLAVGHQRRHPDYWK